MKKADGGPAFASQHTEAAGNGYERVVTHEGMSLRDYFAAQVLPAVFADAEPETKYSDIAIYAYNMADAMLAEREKRNA